MALGTPYNYIGKEKYEKFESLNESQGLEVNVKLLKKKSTVYVVDITEKKQMKPISTSCKQR